MPKSQGKRATSGYNSGYNSMCWVYRGGAVSKQRTLRDVFNEALQHPNGVLARLTQGTHHIPKFSTFAAQQFRTLHPEEVEPTQPREENTPSASKRKANSMSSPQTKKRFSSKAPLLNSNHSPASATAAGSSFDPHEEELLPGAQINEGVGVEPATRIHTCIWEYNKAQLICQYATCSRLMEQDQTVPMSWLHLHKDFNSTLEQQQPPWPSDLVPKPHAPPATTTIMQSSYQTANLLSSFNNTGSSATTSSAPPYQKLPSTTVPEHEHQPRADGFMKFKLFGAKIYSPIGPGHDGKTAGE